MTDIGRFIPEAYRDMVVIREGEQSGVLTADTLLRKACRTGAFGHRYAYAGGEADHALFVYLDKEADAAFFGAHEDLFFGTHLVCCSQSWERFLTRLSCDRLRMTRYCMRPMNTFVLPDLPPLPNGFHVEDFGADAFEEHPFGHGANYEDHGDFARRGVGSVIRYEGRIVCSASSFLTMGKHVETDLFTEDAFRRRGLAAHCLCHLLKKCEARGLCVHWDAQNGASKALAERFGFVLEQEYAVTVLAKD